MGQLPANVSTIKVHPAIGIARLSTIPAGGDYYFVFGEQTSSSVYKSNDLMKRQAVQFHLVSYDRNNNGLEELTSNRLDQLGISVVWTVVVGNAKIPAAGGAASENFTASARSDINQGMLVASLPTFDEGAQIPLGQITPTGLFIPPQAGLFKRHGDTPLSGNLQDANIADNTCDGFVTVQLRDRSSNQTINVMTLGARIVVGPQDYSPDVIDSDLNPAQETLEQWFIEQLGLAGGVPANPVNQMARALDRNAIRPCTAVFSPGIETHLNDLPNPIADYLYPSSQTGDPEEIRFLPAQNAGDPGPAPGVLTSGLCSPWQFDFLACTCSYWASQRPDTMFKDTVSTQRVNWLRKKVNDTGVGQGVIHTPAELIAHVDQLGVARKLNNRVVETERTQDIS